MLKRKDQKNRRLELNTTTVRNLQANDLRGVAGGYASLSRGDDTRCSVTYKKDLDGICMHSL